MAFLSRLWHLLRPDRLLIVALCLLLGNILTGDLRLPDDILSLMFLQMLLPALCVSIAATTPPAVALLLATTGVTLAATLSWAQAVMMVVVLALIFCERPFPQIRVLSRPILGCLLLVYGGWLGDNMGPLVLAATLVFLALLTHEQTQQPQTPACRICSSLAIVSVILLSLLPFLLFDYRGIYLFVMLPTNALMLRVFWLLSHQRKPKQARRMLEIAMAVGAVALAFGSIVQLGD